VGEVDGGDYRSTIDLAVAAELLRNEKLRLVDVRGDFQLAGRSLRPSHSSCLPPWRGRGGFGRLLVGRGWAHFAITKLAEAPSLGGWTASRLARRRFRLGERRVFRGTIRP